MKKLEIDENKAKELYKTASQELKIILEDTFGKEFFSEKITDRIKTWEDVVNYWYIKEGININLNIPYSINANYIFRKEHRSLNALYKIQWINKTLNEGWVEDWNNNQQYKYQPYFNKVSGGWVVSCYSTWASSSPSGFGSYFKSKELALYAGDQFLDIYKDYLPE